MSIDQLAQESQDIIEEMVKLEDKLSDCIERFAKVNDQLQEKADEETKKETDQLAG
ncbi:hypothetical protein [Alkalicoccus luteus]|uniref:Uncharacterized protein n=1 Tax=Alkalicoccus luteus TaxID=1237094 RepID=A0A969PPA7_9BACI|nr:hypothetical protein [Alkalicoccus luteus]NJP37895.1 hypothetical protein [Alkalicoccus luteus]